MRTPPPSVFIVGCGQIGELDEGTSGRDIVIGICVNTVWVVFKAGRFEMWEHLTVSLVYELRKVRRFGESHSDRAGAGFGWSFLINVSSRSREGGELW
jgi:hypothetical protein